MAEYLNYESLHDFLMSNFRSTFTPGDWHDPKIDGYLECIGHVEEFPPADVVEVVRCKECFMRFMCQYEKHLGDDGFCSLGKRSEQ